MENNDRIGFAEAIIKGSRPKTLIIGFAGCVIGVSCIHRFTGVVHWGFVVLTMLSVVFLQIFSNFINDYFDGKKGVDEQRSEFQDGSSSPKRLVASGMNPNFVLLMSIIFAALVVVFGIILLVSSFLSLDTNPIPLALFGVASIGAGFLYSGGISYGYKGLGELFCFIFFGLVLVCGTFFVQASFLSWQIALAGAMQGFFACVVLEVNNIRDIHCDMKYKKMTLAVILGKETYSKICILTIALTILGAIGLSDFSKPAFVVLFVLLLLSSAGFSAFVFKASKYQGNPKLFSRMFSWAIIQEILLVLMFVALAI
jgi:1,4-dihydroxy-2-naphthoate octaprenyltransferase